MGRRGNTSGEDDRSAETILALLLRRTALIYPVTPTGLLGRHDDARAGLGIRIRLVMAQIDAKMVAHIGQSGRVDIPLRPGQLDGANERRLRRRQVVGITTGAEHAFVERGVMRGQKRDPLKLVHHPGPDGIEPRRILHVVPRQAMNIGEGEFPRGWTNPLVQATHNAPVLNNDDPQRAGAVPAVIGGLEVNGGELGHGGVGVGVNASFAGFALAQERRSY